MGGIGALLQFYDLLGQEEEDEVESSSDGQVPGNRSKSPLSLPPSPSWRINYTRTREMCVNRNESKYRRPVH